MMSSAKRAFLWSLLPIVIPCIHLLDLICFASGSWTSLYNAYLPWEVKRLVVIQLVQILSWPPDFGIVVIHQHLWITRHVFYLQQDTRSDIILVFKFIQVWQKTCYTVNMSLKFSFGQILSGMKYNCNSKKGHYQFHKLSLIINGGSH